MASNSRRTALVEDGIKDQEATQTNSAGSLAYGLSPARTLPAGSRVAPRSGTSRLQRIALLFKRYGVVRAIRRAITWRISYLIAKVYARETYLIFSFPAAVPETSERSVPDVSAGLATFADVEELARLSPAHYDRFKALYHYRLRSGFHCWLTRYQNRIVGYVWITGKEDNDPLTGLQIQVQPGSCYALDLYLSPDFRSRGIAPLFMKYGLTECAKAGFNRVVMTVNASNRNMLRLANHLLGAQQIGQIEATRIFGRPHSIWKVGNTSGHGSVTL